MALMMIMLVLCRWLWPLWCFVDDDNDDDGLVWFGGALQEAWEVQPHPLLLPHNRTTLGHRNIFVGSIIFIRSYGKDNHTKLFLKLFCSINILCSKHCGKKNWLRIFFTSQNRPLSESLPYVAFLLCSSRGLTMKLSRPQSPRPKHSTIC